MSIGNRLKELRKELKISQKELGNILNVAQQVVSYYESVDSIDSSKLAIISERYNIDIRYFFEEKPLCEYKGGNGGNGSLCSTCIPIGWNNLLEDISRLSHDELRVVEAVLKAMLEEMKN